MCFDLSKPITWSDIISALSLIVAFGVAIVAICGNRQSQKQFQANMEAQELALNFGLFEKRMEILEYFGKTEFTLVDIIRRQSPSLNRTIESFYMLFSSGLVSEYKQLRAIAEQISVVNREMSKLQIDFFRNPSIKERTGAGLRETWEHLENTGTAALSGEGVEEFREMSHRLCQGLEADYANLLFASHSLKLKYSNDNKDFLSHMEEEIRNSITKPDIT